MSETTSKTATRVEDPQLVPFFKAATINELWETPDGYYLTSWAPGEGDYPAHTAGWTSDKHGWPVNNDELTEDGLIYVNGEEPNPEAVLARAGYEVVTEA